MNLLLESTLRGSILLIAALGLTIVLRHRSASLRHWVLAVAVGCALILPAVSMVAPGWAWGSIASGRSESKEAGLAVIAREPALANAETVGMPTSASLRQIVSTAQPLPIAWRHVAFAAWLLGASLSLLGLLLGLRRLRRIAAQCEPVIDSRAQHIMRELAQRWNLRRSITLLKTPQPDLLLTWGYFRARVILPAGFEGWSDERLTAVVSHELAHVHRGDWVYLIGGELLRAVHWFNPIVWLTCSRLRVESELACDDTVLNSGIAGTQYAEHLLALARSFTSRRLLRRLPAPAMARGSSLERRVSAMLNSRVNRTPIGPRARLLTTALLLALTIPVAGFGQAQYFRFSGTVVDPTNRFLPDTTLSLTNAERQSRHEVKTDANGRFEFVGLPSGDYRFEVRLTGFSPVRENLTLGRDLTRTIGLQVGPIEETVTVAARSGSSQSPPATTDGASRTAASSQSARVSRPLPAECVGATIGPVGGKVRPPVKLRDVVPLYPEHLASVSKGGVVIMEVLIGTDGLVRDVKVLRSPDPDLENAAVVAVRQWRYSQTLLNCEPIELRMNATVAFSPRS